MNKVDFKDPKKRAGHFSYRPGRPIDKLIVEAIRNRVRQIAANGYRGGIPLTTGQFTYPLWNDYSHQHQYIGQQISRLIKEYDLPIRKVSAEGDSPVFHTIDLDVL